MASTEASMSSLEHGTLLMSKNTSARNFICILAIELAYNDLIMPSLYGNAFALISDEVVRKVTRLQQL